MITESRVSLTRRDSTDYSIPIQSSNYKKIILHLTHVHIYLKRDNQLIDITSTLVPIPPSYSQRKMIQFNLQPRDKQLDEIHSIIIRMDQSKSQVDVYQITDEDEKIIDLPM